MWNKLLIKLGLKRSECYPGCNHKTHQHSTVITELGGMGDAMVCLRCGADTYYRIDLQCNETRPVRAPDDWPSIARARKMRNHRLLS